MMETEVVVAELCALSELEEDWDGEGSPTIRADAINAAVLLVHAIGDGIPSSFDPMVTPTGSGEVALEWSEEGFGFMVWTDVATGGFKWVINGRNNRNAPPIASGNMDDAVAAAGNYFRIAAGQSATRGQGL